MSQRLLIICCLTAFLVGCDYADEPKMLWTHSGLGTVAAALSKNGEFALVATVDNGTQFWDLDKNKINFRLKHHQRGENNLSAVAIAKDSNVAVTINGDSLVVWDTKTGKAYRFWKLTNYPLNIALSKTGKYALIGFADNNAQLFDLIHGKVLRVFEHADIVSAVALSEDGQYALIGSDDRAVRLWDLNTGELKHQWFHKNRVNHVGLSPNGQYALSCAAQSDAEIRSTESGELIANLKGKIPDIKFLHKNKFTITASTFSRDSSLLLTGSPPHNIQLWDVESGKETASWFIPSRFFWRPTASLVLALAFDEHNQHFIAQTTNGLGYQFLLSNT